VEKNNGLWLKSFRAASTTLDEQRSGKVVKAADVDYWGLHPPPSSQNPHPWGTGGL
jgi:hypothetical protein